MRLHADHRSILSRMVKWEDKSVAHPVWAQPSDFIWVRGNRSILANELVEGGYLERRKDGRYWFYALTDAGREALETHEPG